jgi:hypothetical protein
MTCPQPFHDHLLDQVEAVELIAGSDTSGLICAPTAPCSSHQVRTLIRSRRACRRISRRHPSGSASGSTVTRAVAEQRLIVAAAALEKPGGELVEAVLVDHDREP